MVASEIASSAAFSQISAVGSLTMTAMVSSPSKVAVVRSGARRSS
jgi:hypothetical protein